jgi:F-type H+-transporting ATPase subunit delta
MARRYASVLFAVTRATGTLDRAERDLAGFATLVSGNPELGAALASPAVPAKKKRAIVEAILAGSGDVGGEISRMLLLLAERGRLAIVPDIVAAVAERSMSENRVLKAEVTTATPITDARRSALAAALGRATKSQVIVNARVDPSLVGGAVARVGNFVYDGSVVRQLALMKQRLLADV